MFLLETKHSIPSCISFFDRFSMDFGSRKKKDGKRKKKEEERRKTNEEERRRKEEQEKRRHPNLAPQINQNQ